MNNMQTHHDWQYMECMFVDEHSSASVSVEKILLWRRNFPSNTYVVKKGPITAIRNDRNTHITTITIPQETQWDFWNAAIRFCKSDCLLMILDATDLVEEDVQHCMERMYEDERIGLMQEQKGRFMLLNIQAVLMAGGWNKYGTKNLEERLQSLLFKTEIFRQPQFFETFHKRGGWEEPPADSKITVCTPFSGRFPLFGRYMESLLSQDIDPSNVHVLWFNTADDPVFQTHLTNNASLLPYASVRIIYAPAPESWKKSTSAIAATRMERGYDASFWYQLAVVRAYNTMISLAKTPYILTLEDDNCPEPHAFSTLLSNMENGTVAAIAPYRNKTIDRFEVWRKDFYGTLDFYKKRQSSITEVGGCGFGCTLFDRDALLRVAPLITGIHHSPPEYFDERTYTHLKEHGKIVCNWDIEVEHLREVK